MVISFCTPVVSISVFKTSNCSYCYPKVSLKVKSNFFIFLSVEEKYGVEKEIFTIIYGLSPLFLFTQY